MRSVSSLRLRRGGNVAWRASRRVSVRSSDEGPIEGDANAETEETEDGSAEQGTYGQRQPAPVEGPRGSHFGAPKKGRAHPDGHHREPHQGRIQGQILRMKPRQV